jgi:hypothetical protein
MLMQETIAQLGRRWSRRAGQKTLVIEVPISPDLFLQVDNGQPLSLVCWFDSASEILHMSAVSLPHCTVRAKVIVQMLHEIIE